MYGKIFDSMYDGTLAARGPWQALVTFQQMIVLANQDGIVDMTAHAISRRTSIPLEIIETGIAELMKPDPESRTPDEDGRRLVLIDDHRNWGWAIVNHAKYQAMRSSAERREYLRVAQATRRARLKAEAASTPVNTVNTVSAKINTSTPAPADEPAPADTTSPPSSEKMVLPARAKPSIECPAGVDSKVWGDWLAVRKAKRAGPVTATAWAGIEREAAKAGIAPEEALRVCCELGWQGFNAGWYAERVPTKRPAERAAPQSFAERTTAVKAARYAEMTNGLLPATNDPTQGEIIDMEIPHGTPRRLG